MSSGAWSRVVPEGSSPVRRWLLRGALLLSLQLAATAPAQTTSESAHAEIHALLQALGSSGCEFNRNGTWYAAADAQAHLRRKLEMMEGRYGVPSAEQFISQAASNSSVSGQAYRVRCGQAAAVDSGTWLMARLRLLREQRAQRESKAASAR